MKAVDSHCHLYFEQFDGDREDVIERSRGKLEFVIVPGVNFQQNKAALDLQQRHPDFIRANMGLHPTYTDSFDQIDRIKQQIRAEDPVAIGEIGLDHHHVTDEETRDRQEEVFREMLELAEELDKPVVIHSREAEKEVVDTLEEYSIEDVMLHCFNGKPELAEEATGRGMKIGVTTQVLYSSRVQEIASRIDLDNILLETDSPFLYRGERNEPLNVLESAEKIAELKQVEKREVIERTTSSSRKIFGL